jgi:uncharacterized repeat protein (TIGR01451 family)
MRRSFVVLMSILLIAGLAPAFARAGGGLGPEPDPTTKPPEPEPNGRADVALVYSGPADILVGDRPTLTFTATNDGPDPAESASLSVSVPPGLDDVTTVSSDPAIPCTWNPYMYAYPQEADGAPTRNDGGYVDCQLGSMAPGGSFSLSMEATRTQAREIYLNAWAGGYTGDDNYENNYVDVLIDADRTHPADLGLRMEAPKSPGVGESFAILMTVDNGGPSDANDVVVNQDLPEGLEFESSSTDCTFDEGSTDPPPPGTSDQPFWEPSSVTCSIDAIPAGGSHAFEVTVRRVSGWELWSSAWVETANFDENYENDYSYMTIAADPSVTSDLSLTSEEPSEPPLVGEEFDIPFVVRNDGPATAGDVSLYDYLSSELEFVSSSNEACRFDDYSYRDPAPYEGEPGAPPADGGGTGGSIYYGGGFLVCDLGVLGSGEAIDLTVRLRRTSPYEIWHYASINASNFDPFYDNNYTELRLAPDKSVVADVVVTMSSPPDPEVGETFDFDISVGNDGPSTARDVVLSDYLPEGLDFVSASEGCVFSDYADGAAPAPGESMPYRGYRELYCELGDIEPGSSVDVKLTATRTFEWEIWNSAWATSVSYDPAPDNDYAYTVLAGEDPYTECKDVEGGGSDDVVVTDACPVDTGPGADDVSIEAGSGYDPREIRTGAGRDDIHVALRTPSAEKRVVEVWSGGGGDVIRVTVAPGSGDARIVIHSAGGNDRVYLDVAPRVNSLRIVVRTAEGNDSVTTTRYAGRSKVGGVVNGGPGADSLLGGNAADHLLGGRGRDDIDAGAGSDLLDGGPGRDLCLGGAGRDVARSC